MAENTKNSFELLKEENENKFDNHKKKIKENIDGRRDIWSFFGEIIELYIPKIFGALLGGAMTGSSSDNKILDDDK